MKTKEKVYSEDDAIQDAFVQYDIMIKAKKKSLAGKIYKQCAEGGKKAKRKQLKSLLTMDTS